MIAATLTDTQGILAGAALACAIVALLACAALTRALRRVRTAQKLVLGDGAPRDVIAHSAMLQEAFQALQEYVGEIGLQLEGRLDHLNDTLAGAISHRALIRYDAYNELSGQQSMSIALLDHHGSGVVLTCIHHRDQARVYAKQVLEGRGELELSPEEADAVRVALGDATVRPARPPGRAGKAVPARSAEAAGP
jgi:hypothetical protein